MKLVSLKLTLKLKTNMEKRNQRQARQRCSRHLWSVHEELYKRQLPGNKHK